MTSLLTEGLLYLKGVDYREEYVSFLESKQTHEAQRCGLGWRLVSDHAWPRSIGYPQSLPSCSPECVRVCSWARGTAPLRRTTEEACAHVQVQCGSPPRRRQGVESCSTAGGAVGGRGGSSSSLGAGEGHALTFLSSPLWALTRVQKEACRAILRGSEGSGWGGRGRPERRPAPGPVGASLSCRSLADTRVRFSRLRVHRFTDTLPE